MLYHPPFINNDRTSQRIAIRLNLAEFNLREPHVTNLLIGAKDYLRFTTDSEPIKTGLVVDTKCFAHVMSESLTLNNIDESAICLKTIVLELPENKRQFSSALAIQRPSVENIPDVNLRTSKTYLIWNALSKCDTYALEQMNRLEVRILELDLSNALDAACNIVFGSDSAQQCWIPLVCIAGERVVVGGFFVDEGDICCIQASADACNAYNAERIYSRDELQSAAVHTAEFGHTPWFQRSWNESSPACLAPRFGGRRPQPNNEVLGIRVLQISTP